MVDHQARVGKLDLVNLGGEAVNNAEPLCNHRELY